MHEGDAALERIVRRFVPHVIRTQALALFDPIAQIGRPYLVGPWKVLHGSLGKQVPDLRIKNTPHAGNEQTLSVNFLAVLSQTTTCIEVWTRLIRRCIAIQKTENDSEASGLTRRNSVT